MTTEDKKVLLRWITHEFPKLNNFVTWNGKRPPVAIVYFNEKSFALECLHGYRGEGFRHWSTYSDKLTLVPDCPRCLSAAKKWSKKEKDRAASRKLDAKVKEFVSKLPAVPRSAFVGSIVASIVGTLIYNKWDEILEVLRAVL